MFNGETKTTTKTKTIINLKLSTIAISVIGLGSVFVILGTYINTGNKTENVNVTPDTITNEKKSIPTDKNFYAPTNNNETEKCLKNNCVVAMIIQKENYNYLKSEIDTWIQDVQNESNAKAEIKIYDNNITKERIRADLKNLYRSKNLTGIVLVGNIPYVKAGISCTDSPNQLKPCLDHILTAEEKTSPDNPFIEANLLRQLNFSDIYYADIFDKCKINKRLDAIYTDSCYDNTMELPFWISRLTPPLHEITQSNQLLKNYFIRNHKFRTGQITFQQKQLVYAPILDTNDSAETRAMETQLYLQSYKNKTLAPYLSADINFMPPSTTDDIYFQELNKRYEYILYNGHGGPFGQQLNIDSKTIISKAPKSLLYYFISCSVGRYSEEGYLAGTYLFQSEALITLAAQTPIFGGLPSTHYHEIFLTHRKTIGETSKLVNFGALKILGDGTLKLRYNQRTSTANPKIMLNSLKLDFGKLSHSKIEKKETFSIKNSGDASLIININTDLSISKISQANKVSVASFNNPNEEITIQPGEVKRFDLNISAGGDQTFTGKYNGYFYIFTSDPINYAVKVPYEGEIVQ